MHPPMICYLMSCLCHFPCLFPRHTYFLCTNTPHPTSIHSECSLYIPFLQFRKNQCILFQQTIIKSITDCSISSSLYWAILTFTSSSSAAMLSRGTYNSKKIIIFIIFPIYYLPHKDKNQSHGIQ